MLKFFHDDNEDGTKATALPHVFSEQAKPNIN